MQQQVERVERLLRQAVRRGEMPALRDAVATPDAQAAVHREPRKTKRGPPR